MLREIYIGITGWSPINPLELEESCYNRRLFSAATSKSG